MERCETCGNDYDKAFKIISQGVEHTFDSYECAINKMAPTCKHCGIKIVGHGVEAAGEIYCCAHCSRAEGKKDLKDRI